MDFFKAQDDARRNTKKLVLYYILAVIGLIISIYLAAYFLLMGGGAYYGGETFPLWMPGLFWTILIVTLVVIASGTGFRVMQLRGGGSSVAEMMGGRKLQPSTKDPKERRLMNIIEEMSIASGVPVPEVYVMDNETGINAFAAGYGPRDAAIGVTRGSLDHLDRDELQGVMAHEFSHIFNGDMRLNIRLIGILNGILVIHLLGMILMRSQMYARIGGVGRGGGSKGRGQSALAMMAFGLALTAIGYLGVIFGRMIQSAVSRQREYLADAAAVQYTRNPDGLAAALAKIQMLHEGSTIKDPHANEMSHLFFSSGQKTWMNNVMATHPPIDKRIEALNATHIYEVVKKRSQREQAQELADERREAEKQDSKKKKGFSPEVFSPEGLVAAAGTISAIQLNSAQQLMQRLSDRILEAARHDTESQNLMYGLLLSTDRDIRHTQLDNLRSSITNENADNTHQLFRHIQELPSHFHIALVDIALPALRQMDKKQYKVFRNNIDMLIQADGRQAIFEFAIRQILFHSLDARFGRKKEEKMEYTKAQELIPEFSVLLSTLSYASSGPTEQSWDAAMHELSKHTEEDIPLKLLQTSDCTISSLEKALDSLSKSSGQIHKLFLNMATQAVAADGKLNAREAGIIRAIAAAIDTPLPLLIPEE